MFVPRSMDIVICAHLELMRESLASLLARDASLKVIAQVESVEAVPELSVESRDALIIADISGLPDRLARSSRRILEDLALRDRLVLILKTSQLRSLRDVVGACRSGVVDHRSGSAELRRALRMAV